MTQAAHRNACLVVLAFALAGCGTMKSVSNSISGALGREESNAAAPTALTEFESRIKVEDVWSKRVGKGVEEQYLKLRPFVLEGRLFVADRYGRLAATELDTGKVIWEVQDKKLQYTGGPGGGEGLVLVGTGDARVIAREADTGKLRWVARVSSEVLSAPTAGNGVVAVRTGDGKLFGLNAETGGELWVYDRSIPTLTLRGNAPPVIDDDLVLAGFDNGRLVALDLRTGKQAWESRLAIPSGRSDLERMVDVDGEPIVVGATVYVASFQGGVAAVSVIDGQIEWTREISSYAELAVGEERVYITDDTGGVWALDRHSGTSVWKQDGLSYRHPSGPQYYRGYVVVGDFEGYMHWLDATTGEFAYRAQIDDKRIITPAIPAGNVLLSYSSTGRLSAVRIQ